MELNKCQRFAVAGGGAPLERFGFVAQAREVRRPG
jgi:hypothetical protein